MIGGDCWGPCCPDCPYKGQAYKPCRVCGRDQETGSKKEEE